MKSKKVNFRSVKWPLALALALTLTVAVGLPTFGQKHEIGIGGGIVNYTGDLQQSYRLKYSSPGINAFYRRNVSDAWSFRFQLLLGQIREADAEPYDSFAFKRSAAFSDYFYEASVMAEYTFFDYKSGRGFMDFSPYLFGGIGVMGYTGNSIWRQRNEDTGAWEGKKESHGQIALPTIPFGVGVKYSLNPRFELGIEFGARKVFTDELDNISGLRASDGSSYGHGNPETDDWYYFTGITVSYTFFKVPCPYDFY
ncbi:hypothetical protein FUAX_35420 [Fulvitalea axinellae]|uniref:DUF6089 domain-containing protein n=1 Tax=Fulvitalea axinellae TaxID=1182444 RepID=A0AAU9DIX4_9BACT|nr:hypothetical protein FUAX_35420 [Fulvitalea axinellae]